MADDWTKKTGLDLGREVVAVGRSLWAANEPRRAEMLRAISRYEGRQIESLEAWAPTSVQRVRSEGIEDEEIRWNLCRTLTDTVTAKVAGTQQPKVSFVASNADWTTRRKGPKLEAFVTGIWATAQEPYSDIWDLGCMVFRDAAVTGEGYVKVWSDSDAGRVIHERVFPWEVMVDSLDAKYGRPGNLFQATTYTTPQLLALFPEHSEAINNYRGEGEYEENTNVTPVYTAAGIAKAVVEVVRCYEWWSLPAGKDVPGKHVLAFDGGVLIEEDWTRDRFPIAPIRWSREFAGWHGKGLIADVAPIDDELNDLLHRIVRTVRLTGMGRVYKHSDDTSPDEDNDDCVTVRYDGAVPPQYSSPAPIAAQTIQLVELLKASGYEFSGVNQMTATAQKQAGIESGSAIRLVADLQSERFAVVWRAYQQLYVTLARLAIDCIRELAEDNEDFSVNWPGKDFLKSIAWKQADLEDSLYTIRIDSAPSVKGTPADRLQTAQELYAAGNLSADALMAVRTYLDLPGELDRASRQRNVIERYIESWLDATPEEIASGTLADGSPLIRPPLRFMRLEDALLQVVDGYMQADLDGAPDETRDLFLRWIEMADAELQKRAQRMAALNQPAPPPGAPPPPAPPGGPSA